MSEQEASLTDFEESDKTPSSTRIETPIGELPSEWEVAWLDDICTINPDGFSEDQWPEKTFEYISLSNVSKGTILQSETTSIDDAPSRAQRGVSEGDVLVGTVRPKQVSHGIVTEEHDGKICSSGFGVLRSPTNLNPFYLLQEVLSRRFFRQMEAYVAGSGYPAVKIGDLRKHRIAVPSLEEQRKIASVLYTVDQAIQKTEEIIDHLRNVRRELIDTLFISGFHEGQDSTETYVGPRRVEYPRHWDKTDIGQITELVTKGQTPTSFGYDYQDEGINFVKVESIDPEGQLDPSEFSFIDDEADEQLSRSRLEEDDILFSIAGALGKVAMVSQDVLPANVNQALAIIRVNKERAYPAYIRYFLESKVIRKYIQSISTVTAQPNLNLNQVSNFSVLLPPRDEQLELVDVISTHERRIQNETRCQRQLKRTKKGLMQDLLSGEVRTHNKPIEVVHEVLAHG